jgi:Flp pilus assembly protein TadD
MHRSFRALAAALIFGVATHAARGDEVDDAQALLRNGATSEALVRVDTFLKSNPKDARGRFLRGVILTEQNKSDEAIAIFRALSEEMPEFPQPHNNLGVLYAAKGRYDDARRVLEMAILADPRYALAHENLGDVYARMAGQSYQRAGKLDPKNLSAPGKSKVIDQLLTPAPK